MRRGTINQSTLKPIFFFVFSLIFFFIPSLSFAATIINTSNTITTSTWTRANSPYLVQGNGRLFVTGGLTIEPGTEIKLYPTVGVYVEGELLANGTEGEPIVFTSYRDDSIGGDTNGGGATMPEAGDWGGIYFDHASGTLNYVSLNYGGNFIQYVPGGWIFANSSVIHVQDSSANLSHITIQHGVRTGITVAGSSTFFFNTSTIHHVPNGLEINSPISPIRNNSFSSTTYFALRNNTTSATDARRNWWGDDSGPSLVGHGDRIVGPNGFESTANVLYDPWIGKRDPVILVPGISGTYLWHGDDEIWPNIGRMLFDIGDNFLDVLDMDDDGNSSDESVVAGDIIRNVGVTNRFAFHIFDQLIELFQDQTFHEEKDLFTFPYDWRLDIKTNSDNLHNFIDRYQLTASTGKIDMVAHSMGGLLVKQYMLDHGSQSIDTVVFVGTPHLGAPKAAKVLLFGDNLDIPILSPGEIKKISRNMLSIYQLLPSTMYTTLFGSYLYDFTQADPSLDNEETRNYFVANDLNAGHLDRAEFFHSTALDEFVTPDGVHMFNISGCKEYTINSIMKRNTNPYASSEYTTPDTEEYMLGYATGDGTVPLSSANALDIPAENRFFVHFADHGIMPSQGAIKNLIVDLIQQPEIRPALSEPIFTTDEHCGLDGTEISTHSPIEIHMYDSASNHVGPAGDGSLDMNIPGVAYNDIAHNTFVFLPGDPADYAVRLQATATGTFNMRVTDIANSERTQTVYYHAVPIVAASRAEVDITKEIEHSQVELRLDFAGNNSYTDIPESAVLDTDTALDVVKPATSILVETSPGIDVPENSWTKEPVNIELSADDDNSGILRIEYSLDNGTTWQAYTGSFVVENDGFVLYRSIDRAGNLEATNSRRIQIDRTPPEVAIAFDPQTRDYIFSGVDTQSSTTIYFIQPPNLVRIDDQAGNSTEMQFSVSQTSNNAGYFTKTLRITNIRRNEQDWQVPKKNQIFTQWDIHNRSGILRWIQTALQVNNGFYVIGRYDVLLDWTTIWRKDDGGVRQELSSASGQSLPVLQTDYLNFIYY